MGKQLLKDPYYTNDPGTSGIRARVQRHRLANKTNLPDGGMVDATREKEIANLAKKLKDEKGD